MSLQLPIILATLYCNVLGMFSFSSLTAEVHQSLPTDKEMPWLELVPCFSDETATVNEAIQADYGFPHGYETDTDSVNVETCSFVTHCNLAHEDELDEFPSLQLSGLKTGELMEIDTHNLTSQI